MHEVVDQFWLLNVHVLVEWLIACPKVLITIGIAIPGLANVYLTVLSCFLFWRRSVRPRLGAAAEASTLLGKAF